MNDKRLEERKRKFLSMDHSLSHENHRISLRKEKINEIIFSKRLKQFDYEEFSEKELEVNINELLIPKHLLEKYENDDDKEYLIEELLFDPDKNVIKFALRNLRGFELRICENGEIELDEKIFDRLLFLLFESEDIQIKYESSYCLTKITYNSLFFSEKLLEIETLKNLIKLTYHENFHIINNIVYIINNAMSQEINIRVKLLETVNLKERVSQIFKSFEILPNFLIESLFILIGNFHITLEKFNELNKENFNYCQTFIPKMFLFLYNNIDKRNEFHSSEKYYWETTFLYIFNLSESDPILCFNALFEFNFFDLIFMKNIKFTENELFYLFRIFTNIFFENSNIIQLVKKYNPLEFFEEVLKSQLNTTKFMNVAIKELCFALSNFACETQDQIFLIINKSQIPKLLLKISKTHTGKELRKEIVIIFKNALYDGSVESKEEIYKINVLQFFADSLSNYEDQTIKFHSLIGIEILLEYGEEMKMLSLNENMIKKDIEKISLNQKIENLQFEKNNDLNSTSRRIIEKYWNEINI